MTAAPRFRLPPSSHRRDFLDIGLPVMNGYGVARALRERPEFDHVHIAAVTGWGQDDDRRKARDAGFDSHFTKPLSPDVLGEVVARSRSAWCLARLAAARRARASQIPVPPMSRRSEFSFISGMISLTRAWCGTRICCG